MPTVLRQAIYKSEVDLVEYDNGQGQIGKCMPNLKCVELSNHSQLLSCGNMGPAGSDSSFSTPEI